MENFIFCAVRADFSCHPGHNDCSHPSELWSLYQHKSEKQSWEIVVFLNIEVFFKEYRLLLFSNIPNVVKTS